MTTTVIGILIMWGIILGFGICVLFKYFQYKKDETYDEVPAGYWNSLEKYLDEKSTPTKEKDDDSEPIIIILNY